MVEDAAAAPAALDVQLLLHRGNPVADQLCHKQGEAMSRVRRLHAGLPTQQRLSGNTCDSAAHLQSLVLRLELC